MPGFAVLRDQMMPSVARNDPCSCGSGKKAKHCCHRLPTARADAEALLTRGQALRDQGQLVAAVASLERGLALMPDFAPGHGELGLLYHTLGKGDAAVGSLQRALALDPHFTWAHCNLGNVLQAQGDLPAAIASYRRALALEPGHVEAWVNLGNALNAQDDIDAAVECYGKALAIAPDHAIASVNIAASLQAQGSLDAAVESLRRALSLEPDFADAHSGLLYLLNVHPGHSPAERLAEARRYASRVMARARPYERWLADGSAAAAARPLRVGLVSADLRSHPVAFCVDGILAHIDPARVQLVAFPTLAQEDETTARIRPRVAAWQGISGLSDEAAAALIHAQGIDVLVDLGGHTAHNRLPVFAWKPAPVQVSWLGYFATTGLPTIDYLLADPVSVPDAHRDQFTETIWHLPDTRLCFTPPAEGPGLKPGPLPAAGNAGVTFGCFQHPHKLNDSVLTAWGRILAALPDARLRLQNGQMRFPAARARMQQRLTRFGIPPARVTMAGQASRGDFLLAHAEVDIILDTFPYPGATTTCEALWMGVPTLTLAGDALVSRQGASLLACAGLDDWVADGEDDYVARALARARDIDGLSRLRATLRPTVLASPLFDAPRFARHLEAAFHGMWEQSLRRRCARPER